MEAFLDRIDSPFGEVDFATDGGGALLGVRFRDGRRGAPLEERLERAGFATSRDEGRTAAVGAQLVEYFASDRRSFDLPTARRGTGVQEAVWEEVARIPFGETRTYGQVAEAVGDTASARDVGEACAANPNLLVIPCHRVVGADGSLKGYAAGLRIKARLLEFEGSQAPLFACEQAPGAAA